jgi:hypothetical protein
MHKRDKTMCAVHRAITTKRDKIIVQKKRDEAMSAVDNTGHMRMVSTVQQRGSYNTTQRTSTLIAVYCLE